MNQQILFYTIYHIHVVNMHKDGSWDPEATVKYEEFKELHMCNAPKMLMT